MTSTESNNSKKGPLADASDDENRQSRHAARGVPEKIDAALLKVAGVVVIGAIRSILDITVVSVALRTFQTGFAYGGAPLAYSTVAWTVTGYALAPATSYPASDAPLGTRPSLMGRVTQ